MVPKYIVNRIPLIADPEIQGKSCQTRSGITEYGGPYW